MLDEEDLKCVQTYEQLVAQLTELEQIIAAKYNLAHPIRDAIITGLQNNTIVEDETVADWNCLYSSYVHWSD